MSRTTAFPGSCSASPGGVDSALSAAMAVDALGPARVHAVMLPYRFTSNELLSRRGRLRQGAGHPLRHRADRRAGRGRRARARPHVRRQTPRHHRGKHPEPHARADPDGDLQQDRRDGGDDRQQVGNVGRLRHALRRHERRLQSDQGPLQDGGVPALGAAQPLEAGRRAGSGRRRRSLRTFSSSRRARNCARTRRTRIRCRPIRCWTASCTGWSKRRCASPTSSPRGTIPTRCAGSSACSISPNTSAASRRPGVKVGPKNFGRDRRYPIVNRFRDPGLQGADAGRFDRAAEIRRDERTVRGVAAGLSGRRAPPAKRWFTGLDPSTLSRNLQVLEREGLVEMAADAANSRRRAVWLTEEGARRARIGARGMAKSARETRRLYRRRHGRASRESNRATRRGIGPKRNGFPILPILAVVSGGLSRPSLEQDTLLCVAQWRAIISAY